MTISDGRMTLDHLLEHRGAVGQQRPAVARDDLDRVERVDVAARHHAAEVRRLVRLDAIVVHDVQRIALLAHVQPGERAPGAADGVERPLLAARRAPSSWREPRRRSSRPSSATSPMPPRAGGRRAGRSRRCRSRALRMSTTSRLPPPRSPAMPSGLWMPETTPSAVSRASSAPERSVTWTPVIGLDRGDEFACRSTPRAAPRSRARAATRRCICVGQRAEAADRGQRRGDRLGLEPAARREAAGEPAQLLLVEERRRRAAEPLVDDETDRVRADVDDGDRAAAVGEPAGRAPSRGLDSGRPGALAGEASANRS